MTKFISNLLKPQFSNFFLVLSILSKSVFSQKNAKIDLPILVPVPEKIVPNVTPFQQIPGVTCGRNLIGASESQSPNQQTPWHSIINVCQKLECFSCSGAIVSDRWIVTTAHCVESLVNDALRERSFVVVGSSSLPGNGRTYEISNLTIHESWNKKNIGNGNDIALLRTVDQMKFSDEVQPICLPSYDFCFNAANESPVTMSGYSSKVYSTNSQAPNLQVGETNLLPQSACEAAYGNLPDGTVCASDPGTVENGLNGCFGDSGSPLAAGFEDSWFLYGVLSFSYGCNQELDTGVSFPSVFTRLTSFTNWVMKNTFDEIVFEGESNSYYGGLSNQVCETDENGNEICVCSDSEEEEVSQAEIDMAVESVSGESLEIGNATNQCDAGCSHACYSDASGNDFCACPTGFFMPNGGDEKTCSPMTSLLVTFQSAVGPDNTIQPTFGENICMFKPGRGLRKGQKLINGPCSADNQMHKWRFDAISGKIIVGDENMKRTYCVMQDHRTGFRPVKIQVCDKANAKAEAKTGTLLEWVNVEGRLRPVNREGYCLQFAGPGAFVVTGPCMNNYLGTLSFEN